MKNYYLLIIATAFFSTATAQSISFQSKTDLTPTFYVDVNADGQFNYQDGDYPVLEDNSNQPAHLDRVLQLNNILWLFNDVGNVYKRTNNPPALLENKSSGLGVRRGK